MFKILGTDQKEYGPATVEQLRQWINEGRVNAQTLARHENSLEWKPIGNFPEFAAAIPPLAPPYLASVDLRKSKLVASLLGIFLGGFGIHRFYLGYTTIGIVQIIVTVLTCGVGHIWGFIEGILILIGNTITTDAEGRSLKE